MTHKNAQVFEGNFKLCNNNIADRKKQTKKIEQFALILNLKYRSKKCNHPFGRKYFLFNLMNDSNNWVAKGTKKGYSQWNADNIKRLFASAFKI